MGKTTKEQKLQDIQAEIDSLFEEAQTTEPDTEERKQMVIKINEKMSHKRQVEADYRKS